MLRAADNEILTRVGPGTLMGDLLRRYWAPACLSAEVAGAGGGPVGGRVVGGGLGALRGPGGGCPGGGAVAGGGLGRLPRQGRGGGAGAGELPAPGGVAVLRP